MLQAVKIRLYPTKEQEHLLTEHFGAVRFVYNRSLALRSFFYKRYNKSLSAHKLIKHLKTKKKVHSWLGEIDSQALQQAVRNMDEAYKHFFRRVKKGETPGFPKFKSRHHARQSFQYPQRVKPDTEKKKIYLPKIGWVKARFSRTIEGKIKTVTVSKEGGRYHAAILTEDGKEGVKVNHNGKTIGIDLGVKSVVADSEGNPQPPICLEKELKKLELRQKQLSRKKKGSNNRKKAKEKLARQHLKIADKRKDFLHKLSTRYSENQTVIVENLQVRNMTRSAKGTIEEPGKNVRAKSGLNRVILQNGWGMFLEMLEYKLRRRGGDMIKVAPNYTSQTCNKCKEISEENRKSQSKFECINCGYSCNADINAARNILDRGIRGNNACQQTRIA